MKPETRGRPKGRGKAKGSEFYKAMDSLREAHAKNQAQKWAVVEKLEELQGTQMTPYLKKELTVVIKMMLEIR